MAMKLILVPMFKEHEHQQIELAIFLIWAI